MSSRCSTAPVAASPASFQPSNATTATGSVSRGRSSEVGLGSITPPSLRRCAGAPRVTRTDVGVGGESSPDRWIGSGGPASAPEMRGWGSCWGRRGAYPPVGVPEPWRPMPQWTLPARRPRTAMPDIPALRPDATAELTALLRQRILVLDGAMGTAIQQERPAESTYRGERFADWPSDLRGNNDLLSITAPEIIDGIHRRYLDAGADLLETNTFNANRISLADYGMSDLAYELNLESARLARAACDAAATPDKPRYVAGALGPTNRTASISPDV